LLLLRFFRADRRQFARVEPVTIAVRTLVHFDSAFGAKEMAHQLDPFTARTISLPRCVDDHISVALDFDQMLSRAFLRVVDALKLKRVEPYAATTALTNVHLKIANLPFSQFIEASWTLHDAIAFKILRNLVKFTADLFRRRYGKRKAR
jgi:hypothetical protein